MRIPQIVSRTVGLFASDPAGEEGELLHREEGGAAANEGSHIGVKAAALLLGEGWVTTGLNLGCEVKTGLIHALGKDLAEHLQIESKLPIKLRIAAFQLTPDLEQIPMPWNATGEGGHRSRAMGSLRPCP
jgi:hypothetical protein